MAFTANWWDEEKTILCYHLIGNWTWEEMWTTINATRQVSRDMQRVDVIVDFQETGMIPADALTHLRRAVATRPQNRGIVVLVGSNIVVRSLIGMAKPLLPRALRFDIVDTIEEAVEIIHEVQAVRR